MDLLGSFFFDKLCFRQPGRQRRGAGLLTLPELVVCPAEIV